MTQTPIELDDRRSLVDKIAADFRRHDARSGFLDQGVGSDRERELHARLLAGPSDTWRDLTGKIAFLLERYMETPEAQDARVRTLVRRALADMRRLMES